MPLDASELDELYTVPLGEFVRARKALASRLRRADRSHDAAEVEQLKKPTAAVWAINQVARQDRVSVERLLRTVERLRALQLGRSRGDAEALKAATEEQRSSIKALVHRAEAALKSAELPASQATLERIGTTLQAAAVDEKTRPLLRRGVLTEELEHTGFGAFAGRTLPPPARTIKRTAPQRTKAAKRQDEARRRLKGALATSALNWTPCASERGSPSPRLSSGAAARRKPNGWPNAPRRTPNAWLPK